MNELACPCRPRIIVLMAKRYHPENPLIELGADCWDLLPPEGTSFETYAAVEEWDAGGRLPRERKTREDFGLSGYHLRWIGDPRRPAKIHHTLYTMIPWKVKLIYVLDDFRSWGVFVRKDVWRWIPLDLVMQIHAQLSWRYRRFRARVIRTAEIWGLVTPLEYGRKYGWNDLWERRTWGRGKGPEK